MQQNLMAQTIVEHPYLVYKDYTEMMSQISGNLVSTLPSLTTLEGQTLSIIEAQIQTERAKETKFIQKLDKFLTEHNLSHLYNNKDYSQMVTIFDAYKKGIINDCNTIQEAISHINKFYDNFSFNRSKQFILDFFDKYGDSFLNQTVDSIFDGLHDYVIEQYKDPKVQSVIEKSVGILSKSYFDKAKHLNKDYKFTEADMITFTTKKTEGTNKTIMEQLRSDLHGIFSGLPGEIVAGGANTGTKLLGGKNPDTDTVIILSSDLSFELTNKEALLDLTDTYEELREVEKEFEDCYIIHESIKSGSGTTIKMKDEATYMKRIEDIRSIFNKLNITNYHDFLFTLANTVPDMAAEDRWNDIKSCLIQLTTMYMFDDIIPDIQNGIQHDTYNTDKLNFYNIRGNILVASEVFQALLNSITKEIKAPTIVSIGRSTSSINYEATVNGITDTQDRWDAVYKAAMTANRFSSIKLNVKNLINQLILR